MDLMGLYGVFQCQSGRYPAKKINSLLVNVDNSIDTKRLKD
jgi:hypothetical protein